MTSVRIEGVDDKARPDLQEVVLPSKQPILQAAFTKKRLFLLTNKGEVWGFKINERLIEEHDSVIKRGPQQVDGSIDASSLF